MGTTSYNKDKVKWICVNVWVFGEWFKKKEKDADIFGALIGRTIGISHILAHSI